MRTRLIPPPGRGIVGMRNAPAKRRGERGPPAVSVRPPPLRTLDLLSHLTVQNHLKLICIKLIRVMGVQLYKLEIGNRKPEIGVLYSYSRLIHDLYKKQLLLNRKIPAQIAILNKNCLYMISNKIIK
ncbi:hypothetical protein MUK42_16231 [Musa troglodytarum]|uniref:Large ribosomal subunit protein bL20c n=1 Tax=Musa troglodytarum TaxID=320322 RepID=A0A9E7L5Q8_9LILI|nr:hypothetical protein MUK42_16231 [Musa troglodytarum]